MFARGRGSRPTRWLAVARVFARGRGPPTGDYGSREARGGASIYDQLGMAGKPFASTSGPAGSRRAYTRREKLLLLLSPHTSNRPSSSFSSSSSSSSPSCLSIGAARSPRWPECVLFDQARRSNAQPLLSNFTWVVVPRHATAKTEAAIEPSDILVRHR